jgi:hypothetical protein
MHGQDFTLLLNEKLKAKGFSVKKVAELSGVPMKHIQALCEGRYHNLPPAPYLRGYLLTLGGLLGFDGTAVWDDLKISHGVASSGGRDELPKNRFSIHSRGAALAGGGIVALLMLSYLGFRFTQIFGQPVLRIMSPVEGLQWTDVPSVRVVGTLENGDAVFVNDEPVAVGAGGTFERTLPLEHGLNSIEISAKKFLGGEIHFVRQIIFESPPSVPIPASTTESVVIE